MSDYINKHTAKSDVTQAPKSRSEKVADEEKATVIAKYIEQHMEHSPTRQAGDIPELFKGYGNGELDEEIADLWRWGIIKVRRNEDNEQEVKLSEFGEELHDKGVADVYLDAKCGFVPDTDTDAPVGVRVME